jgi:hypothetical protein
MTVNISQTPIKAIVTERQTLMLQTEQVQNRSIEIVNR